MAVDTRRFAVRRQVRQMAAGWAAEVLGPGGFIARANPNYEARQPQLDLAAFIEGCIRDGANGVAEAATGVGKSFAYLAPAIRSGKRVVVAVPTIALMAQLLEKDLPFLQTVIPGGFTFALLKGRRNYLCRYKFEQLAEAPSFDRLEDAGCWQSLEQWARGTETGDMAEYKARGIPLPMAVEGDVTTGAEECLGDACPLVSTCFAERAKAKARDARVLVTNLKMLMLDLQIRDGSGGVASVLPDGIDVLIIDECHRLRDEAASAFGREVTWSRFEYVARRFEQLAEKANAADNKERRERAQRAATMPAIEGGRRVSVAADRSDIAATWRRRIEAVRVELDGSFDHYVRRLQAAETSSQRLGDELDILHDGLVALYRLHVEALSAPHALDDKQREQWDKAADMLAELLADLADCATGERDATHVRSVSLNGTPDRPRAKLTITPIDVAPLLRERLWRTTLYRPCSDCDGECSHTRPNLTTVAVSATIATGGTLNFYRRQVGLDAARELMVGSPFDYAANCVLYVPRDAEDFDPTAHRRPDGSLSPEYLDRMAGRYRQCVEASRGRAFCLFTSNTLLDYVYGALRGDLERAGYLVLRQGELPQGETVRRFKEHGRAVLFGVKSYWEGVDVQGEALSHVIISGMPFTPPNDPIFAARCELVDRQERRRMASFTLLSIPEAEIALKQAFGRAIRSRSDVGAVSILDGRLRTKTYGPRVVDSLPPARRVDSVEAIAAFFN